MVGVMLTSTLHDPDNRLTQLILNYAPILQQLFQSSHIVTTPNTHKKITNILNKLKFKNSKGSKIVVDTYKKALKNALTSNAKQIFYCDFDRLLHWIKTHPNELKKTTTSYPHHDFLLIGRTPRAFKTHPETQTMTEEVANQIASNILGFNKTRDIISASWRISPHLAERLVQIPVQNTYGFYCQWPITAWRKAKNPKYIEVEGLEWETPDRYRKEIEEKGYNKWLQEFQTPNEWKKRVNILKDTIASITERTAY